MAGFQADVRAVRLLGERYRGVESPHLVDNNGKPSENLFAGNEPVHSPTTNDPHGDEWDLL